MLNSMSWLRSNLGAKSVGVVGVVGVGVVVGVVVGTVIVVSTLSMLLRMVCWVCVGIKVLVFILKIC